MRQINEKTEDVDINKLWYGCDDVKPRHIDWSDLPYDSWRVIQPYNLEDFKKYGDPWEYNDEAEEKLGYGSYEAMEESNQPMMNYLYPLGEGDEFDAQDAKVLDHLNVCLVYFNQSEEYALALTGGGMDLSWDIVEGYIRLGYLPPLYFSHLPKFAGTKKDARKTVIIDAFLEMMKGTKATIDREAERLKNLYE